MWVPPTAVSPRRAVRPAWSDSWNRSAASCPRSLTSSRQSWWRPSALSASSSLASTTSWWPSSPPCCERREGSNTREPSSVPSLPSSRRILTQRNQVFFPLLASSLSLLLHTHTHTHTFPLSLSLSLSLFSFSHSLDARTIYKFAFVTWPAC